MWMGVDGHIGGFSRGDEGLFGAFDRQASGVR